ENSVNLFRKPAIAGKQHLTFECFQWRQHALCAPVAAGGSAAIGQSQLHRPDKVIISYVQRA
ncbi:MAG: hypothetical protein ACU0C9_04630, partial [Paracoccaceae bacterium]